MTIDIVNEYQLRCYEEGDADKIGVFDKVKELSYHYNPDFIPANIICAINKDGDILGVGHIVPHDTWNLIDKDNTPPGFVYKLIVDMTLNPQFPLSGALKEGLLKGLMDRAKEIREQYNGKNIRVFTWLLSEDKSEIDFYLSKGFAAYSNCLILKYDLTRDIPIVPQPEGISVINNKMETEDALRQYYEAESTAFSGVVWSLNYVRWLKYGPEWTDFSAFSQDRLVGNVMTWAITEERSATDDIFVLPEWRNKGVARYVITEALKYLKSKAKSIATLSVQGDNRKAIALYKSIGYEMFGVMLELGYDL